MPLHEQSRPLTQFVIGNQQYEFNSLFYGKSLGPAAFSAFMSKISYSTKSNHTFRRSFYAITNKRRNILVLEKIIRYYYTKL